MLKLFANLRRKRTEAVIQLVAPEELDRAGMLDAVRRILLGVMLDSAKQGVDFERALRAARESYDVHLRVTGCGMH